MIQTLDEGATQIAQLTAGPQADKWNMIREAVRGIHAGRLGSLKTRCEVLDDPDMNASFDRLRA